MSLNNQINKNMETTGQRKKNGYTHRKLDARIEMRRDDAELRNEQYNELSTDEKIALAKSRRGESKRELARLETIKANTTKPKSAIKVNSFKSKNQVKS